MSLMKDIDELTATPSWVDVGAKFKPLNGRGRAVQDHDMNNHPVRLRNGENRFLYEEESETTEDYNLEYCENWDDIKSSLRTISGSDLEEEMKKRQLEATKRLKNAQSISTSSQSGDSASTVLSDFSANTSVSYKKLENESEKNVDILSGGFERNKLHKNGVIRGLLNQNIISMADLTVDDNEEQYENKEANDCPRVNLVPHPDDPDLLMHPLEAYGKLQYKEDFVLDRIGIKKTMTPKEFYLLAGDSVLQFVKKSDQNSS